MTAQAAHREVERLARTAYGRLLGRLIRHAGNLQLAEDALGDALARALEVWPDKGVPERPEAWLITVSRNRLTDQARRAMTKGASETEVLLRQAEREAAAEDASQWPLPDPRLRLLFACAHDAIPPSVRSPLMLQTVLGLTAARIAPLFLSSPAAMGQQLSRAKSTLADAVPGFHIPAPQDWPSLLPPVLDAIYGAFSAGLDVRDEELAREACYLSELCCGAFPKVPEARGLHALCLYRFSRFGADRDNKGVFIPFENQSPDNWNQGLINRAEQVLHMAALSKQPGRFQLEAAIQSAHIHMLRTGEDRWTSIIGLYTALRQATPNLGAIIGHAAALVGAGRHTEAVRTLRQVSDEASSHQPYWATLAAALAELGQKEEAFAAYTRAMELCSDSGVRSYLETRRSQIVVS
ncbi:RNA polymerase sigma factor [Parvularcula marina]|uniref:RNA polymerase subunit sigma-70 n=1 Tax=Parvularcula marina TaxID=2292771 RepID=A0A371RKV3_9PROT|nr:DUF6596 domain-containing protein [Parvularcula marina]RFB06090.1 RNA polymerase subunit sigma-70 [Parvularcula marina]